MEQLRRPHRGRWRSPCPQAAPLNLCDQLLSPRESDVLTMAQAIPEVKVVDFDDPAGHYAHRNLRGMALLADETGDLLARVAENRPGFPRFPRHRTQSTS